MNRTVGELTVRFFHSKDSHKVSVAYRAVKLVGEFYAESWLLKQILVCKLLVLGGCFIGNNQEWGFQNISDKSFDINTRIVYLTVTVEAVAARECISFVEGGAWKVI